MDKESRDLARREQKTPKKCATPLKTNSAATGALAKEDEEEEKENQGVSNARTRLNFEPKEDKFGHPVYKEISRQNGFLNRQDLSTLKRICKVGNIIIDNLIFFVFFWRKIRLICGELYYLCFKTKI
jgi:hypothetical protein